jgi:hypothetical protein
MVTSQLWENLSAKYRRIAIFMAAGRLVTDSTTAPLPASSFFALSAEGIARGKPFVRFMQAIDAKADTSGGNRNLGNDLAYWIEI